MSTKITYTYNNESYKAYNSVATKKLKLYKPKRGTDNSIAYPEKLRSSKCLLSNAFPNTIVVGLFKQNNEWYRATKRKIKRLTQKQVEAIQHFHEAGGYDCEKIYKVEAREDFNLTYLLRDVNLDHLEVRFNEEPKKANILYIQQVINTEPKTYTEKIFLPVYDSSSILK